MKTLCLLGLLLPILIGCHPPLTLAAPREEGRVYLMKKSNAAGCNLAMMWRKDAYMKNYSCGNDEVYSFYLKDVPAGSKIMFGSDWSATDNDCREPQNSDWRFTVQAANGKTTTGYIQLNDLKDVKEGDLITAGLFLTKNQFRKENIEGKLSCVRMLPPWPKDDPNVPTPPDDF